MSIEFKPIRRPLRFSWNNLRLTAQFLMLFAIPCILLPTPVQSEESSSEEPSSEEPSSEAEAIPSESSTASATMVPVIEIDKLCDCAKKARLICLEPDALATHCGAGAAACANPRACTVFAKSTSYVCKTIPQQNQVGMDNAVELPLDDLYTVSGFYESISDNTDVYNDAFVSYLNEKTDEVSPGFFDSFFVSTSDEEAQKKEERAAGKAAATDIEDYCVYVHELRHLCEYGGKPCDDERPALKDQLNCMNKYLKTKCSESATTNLSHEAHHSLCYTLCFYTSIRAADVRFAESFCLSNRDATACCRAAEVCQDTANIPDECKAEWLPKDHINIHCDAKTTSGGHSCEYYTNNPDLANLNCE